MSWGDCSTYQKEKKAKSKQLEQDTAYYCSKKSKEKVKDCKNCDSLRLRFFKSLVVSSKEEPNPKRVKNLKEVMIKSSL